MIDAFFGGNKLLDAEAILKKSGVLSGMSVGDLGCGTNGRFSLSASHLVGDRGVVYAVDIRRFALEKVVSFCKEDGICNIRPIWADLERYGSADISSSSLDFVLVVNILFQSRKQIEILKEASRFLKKGGRMIVIDWKPSKVALGPSPNLRVNKSDIQAILHGLGLEEIQEFDAGKFHFGMIFEK